MSQLFVTIAIRTYNFISKGSNFVALNNCNEDCDHFVGCDDDGDDGDDNGEDDGGVMMIMVMMTMILMMMVIVVKVMV